MSGTRVSFAIPNLINGVSQQAPDFRLPSQGQEQLNGMSSVVDGLGKRPPTELMAKLASKQWDDAFIHFINRDEDENYAVVIADGDLMVYDLLNGGAQIPVAFPNGKEYLQSPQASRSFRMTTVADYTFVVNNTVEVAMDPDEELEQETNEAIIYIKRGVVNTTYRVMVNDQWWQYKTPEASSTVVSITSGTSEHIKIDASTWSWTQCYNWLSTNGGTVPSSYNPYTWTSSQRGYFYYRSTSVEVTDGRFIVEWCLDLPDATLASYVASGSSAQKAWAAESITIVTSMRTLVSNRSLQLAAAGASTTQATTSQSNTQPSTEDIAAGLASRMLADLGSSWIIETLGSAIRIRHTTNADFTFQVTDSWGNEGMKGIKRETQKFDDLPASCWDGVRVRVAGDDPSRRDDYYLEYVTVGYTQTGVWQESRGWNQHNFFDPTTMPHTLIRLADGTFSFGEEKWDERRVGDDHSVPYPSFVGRKLTDVFFYHNRLGFTVDENVVLSGTAEYFQMWPDSVINVLATDPIDVAATNDTVALLWHASVFGENLILTASQVQFQLGSGTYAVLSPETVRIDKTTSYACSKWCRPVNSGQSLFFVTPRDKFDGVREYIVIPDVVAAEADEVTAHVPRYIPTGSFKMACAINENILLMITSGDPNAVFVYRYYWQAEAKMQSSWSRWEVSGAAKVLAIGTIQSTLYLVIQYDDGVYLESVSLNADDDDEEVGFRVHLDRKYYAQGVYNADIRETEWELPYPATVEGLTLVAGPESTDRPPGFIIENTTVATPYMVRAPGDHSSAPVIVGIPYKFYYEFSPQLMRESRESGAPVMNAGRLQLLRMFIRYRRSGIFNSHVTPVGRPTITRQHRGQLNSLALRVNQPVIDDGVYQFSVQSQGDTVKIALSNDSVYPSTFQAAEWIGTYNSDEGRL